MIINTNSDFNEKYHYKYIELSDRYYQIAYIPSLTDEVYNDFKRFVYRINVKELKVGWNIIQIDDSGDYTCVECIPNNTKIEILMNDIKILNTIKEMKL